MNTEARITMGNKEKKTEEKRRNYWIIGLVLVSSVILLYILIYLSFAGKGFIPTGEYLTKGDWLAFFGTYLSFVDVVMFCYPEEYQLGIRPMKKDDIIEVDNLSELLSLDASYKKYLEEE